MSAGFTPGPWTVCDTRYRADGCDRRNVSAGSDVVAAVPARSWAAHDVPNASLIAAAPELYEALEEAGEAIRELRLADGHAARTGDEIRFDRALSQVCQHENRIKLLLAKARGETA